MTRARFQTFNYVTGSQNYFLENSTRPLWGLSERIRSTDMIHRINSCIDDNTAARTFEGSTARPTILVGRGVVAELKCLQSLGFDFRKVDYIFDTHHLARDCNLFQDGLKLEELMENLGQWPPKEHYHTASNDATFTLQAFLLLIRRFALSIDPGMANSGLLPRINRIAHTGFAAQGETTILPDTLPPVTSSPRSNPNSKPPMRAQFNPQTPSFRLLQTPFACSQQASMGYFQQPMAQFQYFTPLPPPMAFGPFAPYYSQQSNLFIPTGYTLSRV